MSSDTCCVRRCHGRSSFRARKSRGAFPKATAQAAACAASSAATSAATSAASGSSAPAPAPLPVVGGECVVALLASHISSRRRLKYLEQCLRSIAAQQIPPAALYLSWYADDAHAAAVLAAFEAQPLPMRFVPLRQAERLSQYEHLHRALQRAEPDLLPPATSTWLIFSDDDDMWHPRRTELVRLACAAHPSAHALSLGVYAHPTTETTREAASATEVDRALDAQAASIWLGAAEIFQFAVRPRALAQFLRSEPRCVQRHKFCDVRFSQYLRHQLDGKAAYVALDGAAIMRLGGGPTHTTEAALSAWLARHWLYFYRQVTNCPPLVFALPSPCPRLALALPSPCPDLPLLWPLPPPAPGRRATAVRPSG